MKSTFHGRLTLGLFFLEGNYFFQKREFVNLKMSPLINLGIVMYDGEYAETI